ncbi:hypothetical protein DFP81_102245 [Marinomonas pollencensis]|uniref:Uncharacterized protein n=1 Tax=Marinomonas pollencensis TaxID=491954 RepID=A0A3E0DUA0_9GAMM|nr:hypothetical protein DFP81_102245 [Marinomonas pollencensis]
MFVYYKRVMIDKRFITNTKTPFLFELNKNGADAK